MHDPQVLIVGAGPAGLAAAIELSRQGVRDLLVIDRDDAAGGLPRFCSHPGFGIGYLTIPRSGPVFAAELRRRVEAAGVRVLCGTTLISLEAGPVATVTGPEIGYRTIRPRAVLVATGIREANRGNRKVPGERPSSGILTTGLLQQLVSRGVPFPQVMKSVVVVGTEHVSFSAIWTARHAGLKVRMMIDERSTVSSFAAAGLLARLVGVDIRLETKLVSILAEDDRVSGIVVDERGLKEKVACDGVVFTAGWIPEVAALQAGPNLVEKGVVSVDSIGQTGLAGIFAAGNVCLPLKASGNCARQGQQAAKAIASYLVSPRPDPCSPKRNHNDSTANLAAQTVRPS
jgi:thioredoxin reductase